MKRYLFLTLIALLFPLPGCVVNTADDDDETILADAELIELYGGVYEATGREIEVDWQAGPDYPSDEYEQNMREGLAQNYKSNGMLYSYFTDADIVDGAISEDEETSGMLEMDIWVGDDDDDDDNDSSDDEATIRNEVNADHLLIEWDSANDYQESPTGAQCEFDSSYGIEFRAGGDSGGPSKFTIFIEHVSLNPDEADCDFMIRGEINISYSLERTGDNDDAERYFYGEDGASKVRQAIGAARATMANIATIAPIE